MGGSLFKYLGVSLALLSFLFVGHSAYALEYGGIGGKPAYPRADNSRTESIFVHTLEPGQTQAEGIQLINNTSESKTLLVYGVDSLSASDGAFSCKQLADPVENVGTWITLDTTEITLEPATNQIVPFTIVVPEDVDVGEHNGCIVIQEKTGDPTQEAGVNISFRTGIRVAVTVPGEIVRDIAIAQFDHQRSANGTHGVNVAIKNTGNVSIDSNIKLVTKSLTGSILGDTQGGEYPVLRDEQANWHFDLPESFWGGWYQASLIAEYDNATEASLGVSSGEPLIQLTATTERFFMFPSTKGLLIEIGVLLCIVIVSVLLCVSYKRKQWIVRTWVKHTVEKKQDINSLAKTYAVSWKVLAKANHLKPPYTIAVGDTIIVPPDHKEASTKTEPISSKHVESTPAKSKPTKKNT